MNLTDIPFSVVNWNEIPPEEHKGVTGNAMWRVVNAGDIRIRGVEYSPGYLADHWCKKGHIIYVIEGEFISEQNDGSKYTMSAGMGYIVGDNINEHRSYTEKGVKLFIVD